MTYGPERCRPPPAQARNRRQRPHALLRRRRQRRSTLLGVTTVLQQNGAGRQGHCQQRSLAADFAPTPFFSCATAAPAAEATPTASVDLVSSERGIRERNVHFLRRRRSEDHRVRLRKLCKRHRAAGRKARKCALARAWGRFVIVLKKASMWKTTVPLIARPKARV